MRVEQNLYLPLTVISNEPLETGKRNGTKMNCEHIQILYQTLRINNYKYGDGAKLLSYIRRI